LFTGTIPALMTILPIERGKPLGDAAFSSDLIRAYNQKIAQIAAARRVSLIDTRPEWTGADGFMRPGLSSDGVHPSRGGYALLTRDFERAAGSALNRPCG
jgi:lysophospholipase L1-like esterase